MNHGLVQIVALKVIPKTRVSRPDQLQKVKREIELQSRCNHPNIVQMFSNWESKSCVAVSIKQINPRGEVDQLVVHFKFAENCATKINIRNNFIFSALRSAFFEE